MSYQQGYPPGPPRRLTGLRRAATTNRALLPLRATTHPPGIPAAAAHVPAAAGSSSPGEEVWRWWLPWMVSGHPVLLLCLRRGLRVLC
ncbi:hypothetical protein N7499_004386 [Penicillium canescens]|nr:hypothetical protein N7499_004386 [Penicillium canescens]